MKHTKIVSVPAATKEIVDKITCDLCGSVILRRRFEVDSVEISHRVGEQYPEGGRGQLISVDMCGKCFDTKLIPWLRDQCAEPQSVDWEW